jgi:hypothetical protein
MSELPNGWAICKLEKLLESIREEKVKQKT